MKKLIILALFFISYNLYGDYWEKAGDLPEGPVQSIEYDKNNNIIYTAIEGEGIFKSTNKGGSWDSISNEKLVRSVKVNAQGTVFAGLNGGGVIRSTNQGADWMDVNDGLSNTNVTCLHIADNGDIYAGTWFYGSVFMSTNNGDTWESIGVNDKDIRNVYVTPTGRILVGTHHEGLFRSDDGGKNWDKDYSFYGKDIYAFTADKSGELYLGASDGVYRSEDDGTSWQKISSGMANESIRSLIIDENGIIFSGNANDAIYRSVDGGETWKPAKVGIINHATPLSFFIDENSILYAATHLGIYKSVNETNDYSISIRVDPAKKPVLDWNESHEFTVTVLDDLENPVSNIEVVINNGLTGQPETKKTNTQGQVIYEVSIPEETESKDYEFTFKATDETYGETEELLRLINVFHQPGAVNANLAELVNLNVFPNPFVERVNIEFTLDRPEYVSIIIYDAAGNKISALSGKFMSAGNKTLKWRVGGIVSGTYYCRIQIGSYVETRRLNLLK